MTLVEKVARAIHAVAMEWAERRGIVMPDYDDLNPDEEGHPPDMARAAIAVVQADQSAGQSASDARVAALEAENARLREALGQYVRDFCEMGPGHICCGKLSAVDCSGCVARAALERNSHDPAE